MFIAGLTSDNPKRAVTFARNSKEAESHDVERVHIMDVTVHVSLHIRTPELAVSVALQQCAVYFKCCWKALNEAFQKKVRVKVKGFWLHEIPPKAMCGTSCQPLEPIFGE